MKFPWNDYIELPAGRRSTLQVFITNVCNMSCKGCFAKKVMKGSKFMSLDEYGDVINEFVLKGGEQINLIGGEPLLHPEITRILELNALVDIRTTIYTNGTYIDKLNECYKLCVPRIRVSVYCKSKGIKSAEGMKKTNLPVEFCFMVGNKTSVNELVESANYIEKNFNCGVFFISSIRELDNERKEFFDDTKLTMPVIKYKELVHKFLTGYKGNMEIHISKRGVFESSLKVADNRCRFANYFIGGKIIQCPYDIVNERYQKDYKFNERHCQHNNTCLMSKIIVKRK